MRRGCKRRLDPAQTPILTRLSRLVDAVEKKKHDTGMLLSDDDDDDDDAAIHICHMTGPWRFREGVPPGLTTIKDFLRFH